MCLFKHMSNMRSPRVLPGKGSIWIQSRKYNAGPHTDMGGTYPRRLKRLNLTKLEDWRRQGEAIKTFKCLRGFWNLESNSLFQLNESAQPKTHHQKSFLPLKIPRARLDLRKNFFSVRAATFWNSLPTTIRCSSSINAFKNAYDRHMHGI